MITKSSGDGVRWPSLIGALHEYAVVGRRVKVLSSALSSLIPPQARVLDIGCGDGKLDRFILRQRPDASIEGIDVLVRPKAQIPVRRFDGVTIPYPDSSFDAAMFIDVLHHTPDPLAILREARRVARVILIKDHFRNGFLADSTLRLMDWVSNARHGVALPYNYFSQWQWSDAFAELGLNVREIKTSLRLYPPPASWLFDRKLHFVARLEAGAPS